MTLYFILFIRFFCFYNYALNFSLTFTIKICYNIVKCASWNGLIKSTDEDADFSEDIFVSYVINKYGRDIMGENPSTLPPKEYRIYHAFKALGEFHSCGSISGTSMPGASVRQVLPEYENLVLESYILHINNLDYSLKSKRYAYGIVHHYLTCCPLSIISDSQVLGYFNALKGVSKQTIKSKFKVLKRFLVYCFEQGFFDVDYSVLFSIYQKKKVYGHPFSLYPR